MTSMDTTVVINDLLVNLETLPASRYLAVIQEVSPHLKQDDWSALFYQLWDLAESGQSDQALKLMQTCVSYAHDVSHGWLLRTATYFLGGIFQFRGENDQAIAHYQKVAQGGIAAADENGLWQATLALGRIANVRMAQGQVTAAIASIQQAISLDEQLDWQDGIISDQWTLAGLYLIEEQFDRAEELLRETLALAQDIGNTILAAVTWSRLGSLQDSLNNNTAAIASFENALDVLDVAEGSENFDDIALWLETYQDALVGLAMVYEQLENFDAAIAGYAEASRIAYDRKDRRSQAQVLTWLGTAQIEIGRPDLALRSFKAAQRWSVAMEDLWWTAVIYFYQSSVWEAMEQYDKAEQAVYAALKIHTETPGEHGADEVGCWLRLGDLALLQNRIGDALAHFQKASNILDSLHVEAGAIARRVWAKLGEAYWRTGDLARAYDTLLQALSLYDGKRQSIQTFMGRIDFAPVRENTYAYLARTCITLEKCEEAFQVIEESHARVLRERLAQRVTKLNLEQVLDWQDIKLLFKVR